MQRREVQRRPRVTSNSLRVWGSSPLAASTSITALSACGGVQASASPPLCSWAARRRRHRSERAVRVLGKILVARRVEHVDLLAVVLVREHRARDGDASLLLQLHEVRGGPPLLALGLDSTGLRDCATVQQELFRQRGLARVGMADDCKIATPLDLIRESDVHRDTTNVPGGG